MLNNSNDLERQDRSKYDTISSLILIERLVLIYYFFIHPIIILSLTGINILSGYLVFLLIGVFLIYYSVLSNKIIDKSRRYFQITFPFSTIAFIFVIINPIAAFISNILYLSFNPFNFIEIIGVFAVVAFFAVNTKKPMMLDFNHIFIEKIRNWRKNLHVRINFSFLIVVVILILVNYIIPFISIPVPVRERTEENFSLGFWTYGAPVDDQPYKDTGVENLGEDTLDYMGYNNVYLIWGVTPDAVEVNDGFLNGHLNFEERLIRCKNHNVKVHLCFSRYFANIWTIEEALSNISVIKTFLEEKGLWGDPVDTITFDIEPVVEYFFTFYGIFNGDFLGFPQKLSQLRNYDRILQDFQNNISMYLNEWDVNIELCHMGVNPLDHPDGDDDLYRLWGLIDYPVGPKVKRSYMMYRGSAFSSKMIVDAMDIINDNDIVILSGFENEQEIYYNNFQEAVNDGRLVKYYPKKNLNLQIWSLYRFIRAYGEDAVIDYIEAINTDSQASYNPFNMFSLVSDAWYFASSYLDIFFSSLLLLFK